MPLDREHFAGFAQGLLEVAGDVGHRHDEEVAEGVAVERTFLEAVVEELLHQRLGVGQRDQALAEVAGREDAVLVAQPARGSAVVCDRDDGRQVRRIGLKAAQQ